MKQVKGKELIFRISWRFPTLSTILYGLMAVIAMILLDQHNRPTTQRPSLAPPHFTVKDVPAMPADGSNEHGEDGITTRATSVDTLRSTHWNRTLLTDSICKN